MESAAIRKLIGELSAPDPHTRAAAAEQLAHCETPPSEAAAALARACGDEDEEVRLWATSALEDLGPPLTESIGELARLTADPHDDVCYWAVTLLGRAGAAAKETVGTVLGILKSHRSADVRRRAVWAVVRISPAAEIEILDALGQAANDADHRVAHAAQESLAALRGNGKKP